MTSRFLINLQQAKRKFDGTSESISQLSDLVFQSRTAGKMDRFVGSLGAPLSFNEDEDEGGKMGQY